MASAATHYMPAPAFTTSHANVRGSRLAEYYTPFGVCLAMADDAGERFRTRFGVRHGSASVLQASVGGTWADVYLARTPI